MKHDTKHVMVYRVTAHTLQGCLSGTYLCIVELCLHVQRLQNLIENRLKTECWGFLTVLLHSAKKKRRIPTTGKRLHLFLQYVQRTGRHQTRTWVGNCICCVVGLWHFSSHLQATRRHLMRALKYISPGIWRTSENRVSPRTEWCSWPHKLIWRCGKGKQKLNQKGLSWKSAFSDFSPQAGGHFWDRSHIWVSKQS